MPIRRNRGLTAVLLALLWLTGAPSARSAETPHGSTETPHARPQRASALDLRGAWRADEYRLKDGTRHRVDGLIMFAERDWSVLFFVLDQQGQPRRGSGEAGGYTLEGDALVFTHRYNFAAGSAMAGLPESPLSMAVRDAAQAPTEPCRASIDGAQLTIVFPSGNAMTFRRSR